MRRPVLLVLSSILVVAGLVGCATKPKPIPSPMDAEASAIQAEATGLSPSGDPRFRKLDFALLFGSRDSVASWNISILDAKQKTAVKTFKGDGGDLPERISWDGLNDSGSLVPEGQYLAALAVDYGGKFNSTTATSKPFLLDIIPPSATFSPNPALFAYSPNGVTKPIALAISVKPGLAKATTWSLSVFDNEGNALKTMKGAASSRADRLGREDRHRSLSRGRHDLSCGPRRCRRVR